MRLKNIFALSFGFMIMVLLVSSCKKSFLEAKPSTTLVQPHTIADFQMLLSNPDALNKNGSLPIASSDEIVINDIAAFNAMSDQKERNVYIWAKDLYPGLPGQLDWDNLYTSIFYANSVLDGLPSADGVGTGEWNRTKGWALFSRAYAFYDLTRNYCKTYNKQTAATDFGIPLRLSPEVDVLEQRAPLQQTYDQIFKDLSQARRLLTNATSPQSKEQPSVAAVYALRARIYLSMRDYVNAELNADSALAIDKTLINYNTLSKTAVAPMSRSNAESIYWSVAVPDYYDLNSNSTSAYYTITPDIYNSYHANDLRKVIFFRAASNGNIVLKRIYSGVLAFFTGLANDEMYLVKAECAARRSDADAALKYLNDLLVTRFSSGTYTAFTKANTPDVLSTVLKERLKELIRRGLRWSDLKRLNKDGANISLSRTIGGQTYTLPPNDNRYIFPIPDDEVSYSGIQQNPR